MAIEIIGFSGGNNFGDFGGAIFEIRVLGYEVSQALRRKMRQAKSFFRETGLGG